MEHMIRTIREYFNPAPALDWKHAGDGVLIAGRYKIIADRHNFTENDLYIDGEWKYQGSRLQRLMQIAANMERKAG